MPAAADRGRWASALRTPLTVTTLASFAVVAAACSAASVASRPVVVEAGQLTPAEMPPHQPGGIRTSEIASGATTTIPLAKADPTTAFFTAVGSFQSCLAARHMKFVGAPDPKDPSSPANDPNYLKVLQVCAAQSNIVQALKDVQAAQADLTPAQITAQNKAYLKFRTCLIKRGWNVPDPTPDAQGRLFSFGGANTPQLKPPPGQDLFSSPDLRACLTEAQAGANGGGG